MKASRPVYSTDQGRLCPGCSQALTACRCKQQTLAPRGDGIIRISRETKGRGGKGVSLVNGLPMTEDELKLLAAKLKQHCGTGGTVKAGVIEIQGDQRDKLMGYLEKLGYKVKLAGG